MASSEQYNYITENLYPTLYVENFGKIEKAEIEIAPFTLFVGDNNSGKSYLSNLVWLICNEFKASYFQKYFTTSDNVAKYQEDASIKYLKQYFEDCFIELKNDKENKISKKVSNDLLENISCLLNIILDDKKQFFIRKNFNVDNNTIQVEKLKLYLPIKSDLHFEFSYLEDNESEIVFSFKIGKIQHAYVFTKADELYQFVLFFAEIFIDEYIIQKTSFFPSSRTGFFLTYPLININIWGERFNINTTDENDMKNIVFLRSVNSFVQDLMKLPLFGTANSNKDKIAKLKKYSDFIEQDIINGEIFLDHENKSIKYKPQNSEVELSMHTTSAIVTELAPLVLLLKYGIIENTLFMEEPEISLHPELQQQITRLFIKMVNDGKQVITTTHSDTIIQHLNNMIKLYNNPSDRQNYILEKFNYTQDDMIDPDKVRVYQFDVKKDNDKTSVIRLNHSKYGFKVPTFNDFLNKISDEVEELLEEL